MQSALAQTYATLPFEITRGEGVYVFDKDDKQYLDLYGGHAVAIIGHSPPALVNAITEQAKQLLFYSNVAPLEIRERAARAVIEFHDNIFSQVFFCNSGTEANENALKLAIKLTGRDEIVAFSNGFHGRTTIASAATDKAQWHKELGSWCGPVKHLAVNAHEQLEAINQQTAAVILEPIQSMAGVISFEKDFLEALCARAKQVGALVVFDEVQTGVGRCGVPCMSGSVGVTPDMMTLAKSLGGGFPVGAMLLSDEITQKLELGDLGSTFGGGPLAMAAVIATLELIDRHDCMENAKAIEAQLRTQIDQLGVAEVRGAGCLIGLKFDQDARPIQRALLEREIITGVSADPSVVRLLMPLVVEPEHIDQFSQVLAEICKEEL